MTASKTPKIHENADGTFSVTCGCGFAETRSSRERADRSVAQHETDGCLTAAGKPDEA
jgi:hypothetical protein